MKYKSFLFQIIFRKVADVKKEKELAEKRKNDPPLELANDHPVRKLISRFRKMGDKANGPDSEKGNNSLARLSISESRPLGSTKIINVSETSAPVTNVPKLGGGASKWGKLLAGTNNNDLYKVPESTVTDRQKLSEKNNEASKSITKHVVKLTHVLENRIDGTREDDDDKNNLKKTDSNDSGILKSNNKLDQISNGSIDSSQCSHHQSAGALSVVEQQMLTSLFDIRLEFKEEMELMHQKMSHIDDQISEILRMFSPSVSPCSSHMSTFPHSKFTSPHSSPHTSPKNTTSNSVDHSPKTSISSSPRHTSHGGSSSTAHNSDLANMCDDVINMNLSHAQQHHQHVLHHQESGRARLSKSSSHEFQNSSFSSQASEHSVKSQSSRIKSNRVSPEATGISRKVGTAQPPVEIPMEADETNIPFKNQDLDIL